MNAGQNCAGRRLKYVHIGLHIVIDRIETLQVEIKIIMSKSVNHTQLV